MTAPFRFPFELLEQRILQQDPDAPPGYVANRLGITGRQVQKVRQVGLTERQADLYATKAGHHPGEIWPYWWLDDLGRMFAKLQEAG